MSYKFKIEIFFEGRWHPCAEVLQEDGGLKTLNFSVLPMDQWREQVERRREDFLGIYG